MKLKINLERLLEALFISTVLSSLLAVAVIITVATFLQLKHQYGTLGAWGVEFVLFIIFLNMIVYVYKKRT